MSIIYVPKDYITIQEAIDEANSGDIIEISPGVFTENLTIIDKDNITLTAQPATVLLEGANKGGFGVIINANNIQIRGLQFFRYTTGIVCKGNNNIIDGSVSNLNTRNGISIDGNGNIVSNCRFKTNLGTGITVMGNYNLCRNNRFESNGVGAIGIGFGVGFRNIFYANVSNNDGEYGISIFTPKSEENIIYKNSISGGKTAYLITEGKQYLMQNVAISNPTSFYIQSNNNIIYHNNSINSQNGMVVNSNYNKIINNFVSINKLSGVTINGDSNLICNNVITNAEEGIAVTINGVCNKYVENKTIVAPSDFVSNDSCNYAKRYKDSIYLLEKLIENNNVSKELFDKINLK